MGPLDDIRKQLDKLEKRLKELGYSDIWLGVSDTTRVFVYGTREETKEEKKKSLKVRLKEIVNKTVENIYYE